MSRPMTAALLLAALATLVLLPTGATASPPGCTATKKLADVEKATSYVEVGRVQTPAHGELIVQCMGDPLQCRAKRADNGKILAATVELSATTPKQVEYTIDATGVGKIGLTFPAEPAGFHKGPFAAGARVELLALDDAGQPGPPVLTTRTLDDRGSYVLDTAYRGPALVRGTGRSYDEARGVMLAGPIELCAVVEIDGATPHVNAVTHLSAPRVLSRVQDGEDYGTAIRGAEAELLAALAVDGEAGAALPGREMDLLEGEASALLLALSARITAAAARRADATGDAPHVALQGLLDELAADLADDGLLEPVLADELAAAGRDLDPRATRDELERHLSTR